MPPSPNATCADLRSALASPPAVEAPSQDESRIFVVGLPKTGTSSLHVALKLSGISSCHTSIARLTDLVNFVGSPLNATGSSAVHRVLASCRGAVLDVPWFALNSVLTHAWPKAKFILTRWSSGCASWASHFQSLLDWGDRNRGVSHWIRGGIDAWHDCVFGPRANRSRHTLEERCREHERSVMAAHAANPQRLLLLPVELASEAKWRAVHAFLNVQGNETARNHHLVRDFLNVTGDVAPRNDDLWASPWPHFPSPNRDWTGNCPPAASLRTVLLTRDGKAMFGHCQRMIYSKKP